MGDEIFKPPVRRVAAFELAVAGNERIEQISRVNVSIANTSSKGGTGVRNSVYDPRMGVSGPGREKCDTCVNPKDKCPGHHGRIDLPHPIQNALFREQIEWWLNRVCHDCGAVRNKDKDSTCTECGKANPKVSRDKNDRHRLIIHYEQGRRDLSITKVEQILGKVTPETVQKLGQVTHPSLLVVRKVVVLPIAMRPDSRLSGNIQHSTYTYLSKRIITLLKSNEGKSSPEEIQRTMANIDFNVHTMIAASPSSNTNSTRMVARTNNAQIDSISHSLSGKTGILRKHTLGKRVLWSARSVIIGDPNIDPSNVGVPIHMCKILLIPVTVRSYNQDELIKLVANGDTYPGARYVQKLGGEKYDITVKSDIHIEPGDVVYRHMMDGDPVMFNRAPTLMLSCLNVMRVTVVDGKALRMHLAVTTPYNADFDGDEMNLYVLTSEHTRFEAKTLMSISERMISHQTSTNAIGMVHDTIVGASLMTRHGVKFTKTQAMHLIRRTSIDFTHLAFTKQEYTAYELISMLLPPTLNYKGKSKTYEEKYAKAMNLHPNDGPVRIENGRYYSGILDKSTLGDGKSSGLFHLLANKYGNSIAMDVLRNIDSTVLQYNKIRGFTISVDDLLITPKTRKQIRERIGEVMSDIEAITQQYYDGKIIPPPGVTVEAHYESLVVGASGTIEDMFRDLVMLDSPPGNGIIDMLQSGSKGKPMGRVVSVACIGQQLHKARRIPHDVSYGRSFPGYPAFDLDPRSRGFVPECYIEGVSPVSLYSASLPARRTFVDKQLETSVSGMWARLCASSMQVALIDNYGYVTAGHRVLNTMYGDLGMDVRRFQVQELPTTLLSNAEFSKYKTVSKPQAVFDVEYAELAEDRALFRKMMFGLAHQSPRGFTMMNKLRFPVSMQNIMRDAIDNKFDDNPDLAKSVELVKELCDRLPSVYVADDYKPHGYQVSAVRMLQILIRSHVCSYNIRRHKLSLSAVRFICDEVWNALYRSVVDPGTSVGTISAYCMSHVTTQLALNSIHSVQNSINTGPKTNKLRRFIEIMELTPTARMENPSMQIAFPEGTSIDEVRKIANKIERVQVQAFVDDVELYYEPFANPVHPKTRDDIKWLKPFIGRNTNQPPHDVTNWCVRFELNRVTMVSKSMDLETVIAALNAMPHVYVAHSSNLMQENPVVRMYWTASAMKRETNAQRWMENIIETVINVDIRGVEGIKRCMVRESDLSRPVERDDGTIEHVKLHVIETAGSNLAAVLMLPDVHEELVETDCIDQVYEVYGIEAARIKIISELRITFDASIVSGVEYCHFVLFADVMCMLAYPTKMSRDGVTRRFTNNTLLRMAAGGPKQGITKAALGNYVDDLVGPSSQLILGQMPKMGSSYNDVGLDYEFVQSKVMSASSAMEDM